jgi:hypothetical protein
MKTRTLVYAPAICILLSIPAFAQQLPRFNIEATCRSAPALVPQDRDPVQGCLQDEADAERQLRLVWSSASAAQRETCAAETQVEGTPSYVEVLICLQMYQDTASTAPSQRRKQR